MAQSCTYTLAQFQKIVFTDFHQDQATCNFWEDNDYFIFHLNAALCRLYEHTNWSWNLVVWEEQSSASPIKEFELDHPIQEILKVEAWNGQTIFDCDDKSNIKKQTLWCCKENRFYVIGNTIYFNEEYEKIKVTYRRGAPCYTTGDMTQELDLPCGLHLALRDLMLSQVIHLWLGEGLGQYAINFIQEAQSVLRAKAQMDKKVWPLVLKPRV